MLDVSVNFVECRVVVKVERRIPRDEESTQDKDGGGFIEDSD